MADLTVIGIDPGSRFTGWGIVREASGVLSLVDCGLVHSEGQKNKCFSARLARIYSGLNAVLGSHNPDEAAMEQVFTAKNAASALKLGQARGPWPGCFRLRAQACKKFTDRRWQRGQGTGGLYGSPHAESGAAEACPGYDRRPGCGHLPPWAAAACPPGRKSFIIA